jgi:hypothetical protein
MTNWGLKFARHSARAEVQQWKRFDGFNVTLTILSMIPLILTVVQPLAAWPNIKAVLAQ